MIYISYFAKAKSISDKEVAAICQFPPKWFKGKNFKFLAPTKEILTLYKAGRIDWEIYSLMYKRDVLDKLDVKAVTRVLGDNICLCCFEKNGENCHRYLLADWLRSNGIEVEEI